MASPALPNRWLRLKASDEALEVARRQYPDDSRLHHVLKSAVGAGTTTDPQWAGSLSEYQEYAQDFIDYLRPQTIIGRFGQGGIPALRQVPFNIRVHAQVSGGAAGWVRVRQNP